MYFARPPKLAHRIYKDSVWRILTEEEVIYLTFDDGPSPEVTPWVLKQLKKYNAKATFFCVGKNVIKHPGIYKQIIAEGHSVGNHSFSHLNGWKTGKDEYIRDVIMCAEVVDSRSFRPPYGKITLSQYATLNSQYTMIMWNVLSRDYDKSISKEKCLKNVLENAKKGSIVVFHDSIKANKNLEYVLPRILDHFAKEEMRFEAIPFPVDGEDK